MNTNALNIVQEPTVARNGVATPCTATARANESTLLRAFQDVGYRRVGDATGHDKSWVTRLFSDEARMLKSELLCALDIAGLQIVAQEADRSDEELMLALLRSTTAAVSRSLSDAPEAGSVAVCASEYRALLVLAQRQIEAMKAQMEPPAA